MGLLIEEFNPCTAPVIFPSSHVGDLGAEQLACRLAIDSRSCRAHTYTHGQGVALQDTHLHTQPAQHKVPVFLYQPCFFLFLSLFFGFRFSRRVRGGSDQGQTRGCTLARAMPNSRRPGERAPLKTGWKRSQATTVPGTQE